MLRVLTLSTLFPHSAQPTLGIFVEQQTRGLAGLPDVALEVLSPVGLPPFPFSLHPHYSARARLPRREQWQGLSLHRPRFRVIPMLGGAQAARAMARALLPYVRALKDRFAFDVIDAEFFWQDGPAAMHLSKALNVPFSLKARGADIHYWGARPGVAEQILEAGRTAGGLLAVSEALKADMATLGLPAERIRVHYTGIDLSRFEPIDRPAAKARLGVEGPLLVTPGALIPRKGQALVLEALGRLDGATLMLIGDGPDRRTLVAAARRLGVASRVRFLGRRPHEDLPALLAAADVMVLPSVSEGLANVWVEALACGTPVVISDVGGAREAVYRREAGRIVPREPGAIAAAVRELLGAPAPPAAVRAAAERFSWDRNARELREHLGSLAPVSAAA